jgi:hypothetical protein
MPNTPTRDKHLRRAHFFDVENLSLEATSLATKNQATTRDGHSHGCTTSVDGGALACTATLQAAGHVEPIEFAAHDPEVTNRAVALTADVVVGAFGSPPYGARCGSSPPMCAALSPRGSSAPDPSHRAGPGAATHQL